MERYLWSIGIVLQFVVGFIFLLDHINPSLVQKMAQYISKWFGAISGDPRQRLKISLFATLISVPTVILVIIYFFSGEAITWPAIGGLSIFILIGYVEYLYVLKRLEGRLQHSRFAQRPIIGNHPRRLLVSNAILFGSTIAIWVIWSYISHFFLYPDVKQSIFVVFPLFIFTMSITPILMFSLSYLISVLFLKVFKVISQTNQKQLYIILLTLWCLGGSFLLVTHFGAIK